MTAPVTSIARCRSTQGWRSARLPGSRRQRGISLIALASILVLLSALIVALGYKTSDYFSKGQVLDSDALLRVADNQLRQYIVANGRLPCPDLDGDGFSDGDADGSCKSNSASQTQQKGSLPYKTLGLTDKNYVYGEVPMLYGVYNTAAVSFTSRSQTFFPSYQDKDNQSANLTTTRNTFDFCTSLVTLRDQAAPTLPSAGLGATDGTNAYSAVYALALPGQGDRDPTAAGWAGGPAINAQYDGRNATSPNWFELPQRPVDAGYDDRTAFRTALDLHEYYRCESMLSSISVLAEAVTVQKETEDFADSNAADVQDGLAANVLGIQIALWNLGQSIAAVASGAEVLSISSGLLSAVSATCPIPPFVTCALIPVYATAVANASIGLGLAGGALVASTAALALQFTAKQLYADLATRTATAPTPAVASSSNIPVQRQKDLLAQYVSTKGNATTAYAQLTAYGPAPTAAQIAGYKADRNARIGDFNNQVGQVQDSTLQDVLSRNFNGRTASCTPPDQNNCAGYTARQVPRRDGNGNLVKNTDGSLVYDTIYTLDLLANPYAPGVVLSVTTYYQALAQSDTPKSPTAIPPGADQATRDAIAASNASLASAPTIDPAQARSASNAVLGSYSSLLAAAADFDRKNLAYDVAKRAYDLKFVASPITNPNPLTPTLAEILALQASLNARNNARDTLRIRMADPNWDYPVTGGSLCGGGSTSGCGWMDNATAGGSAPLQNTGSAAANNYLASEAIYQNALAWQKLKDAADTTAGLAWSDRNTLKTTLCAVKSPAQDFVGAASRSSDNPNAWDQSENVLATDGAGVPTPVNLSCTGLAPADRSGDSAAAQAAEKAKYCTTGTTTYDAALCAVYSGTAAARSTIRGADAIVNRLIEKGIAK